MRASGPVWTRLKRSKAWKISIRAVEHRGRCGRTARWLPHMLNLLPAKAADSEYRILCLGAHSDDIEIGCGGTMLRLLKTYSNVNVTWVVFSATGSRGKEAQSSAEDFLKD